jgi:hypothetical protein
MDPTAKFEPDVYKTRERRRTQPRGKMLADVGLPRVL